MDGTLNLWALLYLCLYTHIYMCLCVCLYPYTWLLSPSVFSNVTEEITAAECCTIKECGNTFKYVNIHQGKNKIETISLVFKV